MRWWSCSTWAAVTITIAVIAAISTAEGPQRRPAAVVALGSCNRHDADQAYWPILAAELQKLLPLEEGQQTLDANNDNAGGGDVDVAGTTASRRKASDDRSPLHSDDGHRGFCRADAFFWLGDAVYADTRLAPAIWVESPIELVRHKFQQQRSNPHYAHFVASSVKAVHGVWDDHDMGQNDGGRDFASKTKVQQMFLDFLDVPPDSPRRKQEGLYSVERMPIVDGHPLAAAYRWSVCAVFLDVRYFKDDWDLGAHGDMLGEAQWHMLRQDLAAMMPQWRQRRQRKSTPVEGGGDGEKEEDGREACAVTVIVSGIQILMDVMPTEQWSTFPRSRDRLYNLIRCLGVERVVFASGDVHFGEIAADGSSSLMAEAEAHDGPARMETTPCGSSSPYVTAAAARSGIGYPIVELTTSGLTHTAGDFWALRLLFTWLFPSKRRRVLLMEKNFGTLVVDGTAPSDAAVTLRLHSLDRPGVAEVVVVPLRDLAPQHAKRASLNDQQQDAAHVKTKNGDENTIIEVDDAEHQLCRVLLHAQTLSPSTKEGLGSIDHHRCTPMFLPEPEPWVKWILRTSQRLSGMALSHLIYLSMFGFTAVVAGGALWSLWRCLRCAKGKGGSLRSVDTGSVLPRPGTQESAQLFSNLFSKGKPKQG